MGDRAGGECFPPPLPPPLRPVCFESRKGRERKVNRAWGAMAIPAVPCCALLTSHPWATPHLFQATHGRFLLPSPPLRPCILRPSADACMKAGVGALPQAPRRPETLPTLQNFLMVCLLRLPVTFSRARTESHACCALMPSMVPTQGRVSRT